MSILYRLWQFFWSLYFMLSIALVGLVMGYGVSFFFYLLSFICTPFTETSLFFCETAEYVQCFSIYGLLKMQPWLKYENNFQPIFNFFKKYKTKKIIFVANHRSNLDTFLLISLIPGLRGMAKRSLFYNILFAPYMLVAGFVPVKKGSVSGFIEGLRVLKNKILEKDRAALVFPETTRCTKGFRSIGKFSSAVFATARSSDSLVVPIYIHKSDELFGRGDWLLHPFQPVRLKIFDAISATDFKDEQDLSQYVFSLLRHEQDLMSPACN